MVNLTKNNFTIRGIGCEHHSVTMRYKGEEYKTDIRNPALIRNIREEAKPTLSHLNELKELVLKAYPDE